MQFEVRDLVVDLFMAGPKETPTTTDDCCGVPSCPAGTVCAAPSGKDDPKKSRMAEDLALLLQQLREKYAPAR